MTPTGSQVNEAEEYSMTVDSMRGTQYEQRYRAYKSALQGPSVQKLVGALENCKAHAWLDDPQWNDRNTLAFAARCGLVDQEVTKALREFRGEG